MFRFQRQTVPSPGCKGLRFTHTLRHPVFITILPQGPVLSSFTMDAMGITTISLRQPPVYSSVETPVEPVRTSFPKAKGLFNNCAIGSYTLYFISALFTNTVNH